MIIIKFRVVFFDVTVDKRYCVGTGVGKYSCPIMTIKSDKVNYHNIIPIFQTMKLVGCNLDRVTNDYGVLVFDFTTDNLHTFACKVAYYYVSDYSHCL